MSVGERMVDNFDEEWVKLANGFGGGIAEALDVCGAIVGAVMLIGALYGRRDPTEDQSTNWRLCRDYYDRFVEAFQTTNCQEIRQSISDEWTHRRCAVTVKTATQILLKLLAEENDVKPTAVEE